MDKRTRKLMTLCNALHARDNKGRLYVLRKEGGRGLTNIDISKWLLKDYMKKSKERLTTAMRNNTNNAKINRTTITRK